MGTEYYLLEENYYYKYGKGAACKSVQPEYTKKLIGKSSYGWAFQLHTYAEDQIYDLRSWLELFEHKTIVDENDNIVPVELMSRLITKRDKFSTTGDSSGLRTQSGVLLFPTCHYEMV